MSIVQQKLETFAKRVRTKDVVTHRAIVRSIYLDYVNDSKLNTEEKHNQRGRYTPTREACFTRGYEHGYRAGARDSQIDVLPIAKMLELKDQIIHCLNKAHAVTENACDRYKICQLKSELQRASEVQESMYEQTS